MSHAKYSGFEFSPKVGLPVALVTTDSNGSGFDRLTYSHMLATANATVNSGTGNVTIKVQDSADNSTGWADLTPNVVFDNNLASVTTASFPAISTDGVKKLDVDLSAAKRYIRFVKIASATGSPSIYLSVVALLGQRDGTQPGA